MKWFFHIMDPWNCQKRQRQSGVRKTFERFKLKRFYLQIFQLIFQISNYWRRPSCKYLCNFLSSRDLIKRNDTGLLNHSLYCQYQTNEFSTKKFYYCTAPQRAKPSWHDKKKAYIAFSWCFTREYEKIYNINVNLF